jgi:hypothetical protein
MGCFACARRQDDPSHGQVSDWRRAVVDGEQVLVCPDCFVSVIGLDACTTCSSTALVKKLGEISCRSCGATWFKVTTERRPSADRSALAREVGDAIDRLLRDGVLPE